MNKTTISACICATLGVWVSGFVLQGAPVKISERFGFDPTNSTRFIQQALDSGLPEIVLDDKGMPWITEPLKGRSNQTLYFEDGVTLLALKGAYLSTGHQVLCYNCVSNIAVVGLGRRGGTIRMHKSDYQKWPYKRSEWRHTIMVWGVSGFRIENMLLAESGGDGIELYGPCRNGVICRVVCDGHHRNALSVCSARGLLIEDCAFTNTKGTGPGGGVDFEPDRGDHAISDIVMRNYRIEGNEGNGIDVYSGAVDARIEPFSVTIENCVSACNLNAVRIGGGIGRSKTTTWPQGRVTFTNCTFTGSRNYAIRIDEKPKEAFALEFIGCKSYGNAGGDENVDVLFRSAANPGWKPGGITFKDFTTQKESRWCRSWAAWVTTQNPTPKDLPDIKGKVNVITADGKPTVSVEM